MKLLLAVVVLMCLLAGGQSQKGKRSRVRLKYRAAGASLFPDRGSVSPTVDGHVVRQRGVVRTRVSERHRIGVRAKLVARPSPPPTWHNIGGLGTGSISIRLPDSVRPPQLFVELFSKNNGGERIGVQEELHVERADDDDARASRLGREACWGVSFNFTCLHPGAFQATVFLEQRGEHTRLFPPPSTWRNDSLPPHPRPARSRPDNPKSPEYALNMPTVTWKELARDRVACWPEQQRQHGSGGGEGSRNDDSEHIQQWYPSNVVPRRAGSWVPAREALPRNTCCPWNAAWFQRVVEKSKQAQQQARNERGAYTKYTHYVPHDGDDFLNRGRPLTRFYLQPDKLSSALATAQPPPFTMFLGDSVLNNIWEAFVAMAPAIMRHIDWRFGGVIINKIDEARGWHGGGPSGGGAASLMKWLVNVSFDRYSNLTDFAVSAGTTDRLFRAVGRPPTHVVINAGLWDAQSRPPSEFAKYLPILIRTVKATFPGAHIVWLTSPPVDAAKLKGRHYRTNEYLTALSRIAKSMLGGMEGVTVVDGFGILSAVRDASTDGRHYPASICLDVANILWNVILPQQSSNVTTTAADRSQQESEPQHDNTPVTVAVGAGLDPKPSCSLEQTRDEAVLPMESFLPELCKPEPAKYTNAYCRTLPPVSPSVGCNLLDLSDPRVYAGPERELVLWGDSVMRQLHFALLCQLARNVPEGVAFMKLPSPLVSQGHATHYNATALPEGPCNEKRACFRFGSLSVCHIPLTREVLGEKTAPCLLAAQPHDVHIFNVGMWHNEATSMMQAMTAFKRYVIAARDARRTLPHLVWQESTPQHFQSKGGNYEAGNPSSKGCMRKVNSGTMRQHEWRNDVTRKVLNGVPGVRVFHVWELLHLWPQLHVQKLREKETDCTHWCATPTGAMASVAQILMSDVQRTYWWSL